jgi:hypothetical protein
VYELTETASNSISKFSVQFGLLARASVKAQFEEPLTEKTL